MTKDQIIAMAREEGLAYQPGFPYTQFLERFAARVAAAERERCAEQQARIAELEKDAARYRWLCANSFDKEGVTQFHVWEHSWAPHSQTGELTEWKQRVRGPSLDTFIDAAMQGEAE